MSMKISMMGCSNTGKTCYLYGTYQRMLDGISGFNFNPSDLDKGLELQNFWYSLLEPEACWPVSSNQSEEYPFDVFFEGEKLGEFTWLDYRGEILYSRQDSDPQNEVSKFYKWCSNSDSIIVAIPADVLKNACGEEYQSRMAAKRMLDRYKSILLGLPNRNRMPVVLMITKGDLITTKNELRSCIAKLKEVFDFLFNQNQEAVMIVRTQLGRFRGDMRQGGLIEGEFDPQFIHLPILFPLYLDFSRQAEGLRRAANNEAGQGWWGKFWNGDDSARLYRDAAALQKKADALWEEFVGAVDIYQRGDSILNSSGVK
ncbi:MAG: hypothetical protein Q4D38_12105 [Planctomycetia bacterium]|nr:hypothetical protein [Planctomycetia bacterium]